MVKNSVLRALSERLTKKIKLTFYLQLHFVCGFPQPEHTSFFVSMPQTLHLPELD